MLPCFHAFPFQSPCVRVVAVSNGNGAEKIEKEQTPRTKGKIKVEIIPFVHLPFFFGRSFI
jgi:hypothetical protein